MLKARVLIVEDSTDARELYRRALEAEGIEVAEAQDGKDALIQLQNEGLPDVILLDINMPNLDGGQFMKSMRENPNWSGIKVIVVSGWVDIRDRAKSIGAWGFLKKPFDLHRLYELITKALER